MRLHLAIACAALCAGAPAWGKSKAEVEVERLARDAEAAYKKGDFRKSAELLLRAYEVQPLPKLLYNAARAYDKDGDAAESMRFYQRYIDAEGTDAELVKRSARALERLRASLPPQPAPTPPPPEVTAAPAAPEVPPAAIKPPEVVPPPEPRRALRPFAYLAGGLAVVALGGGTYFGITANREATAFKTTVDPEQKPVLRDQARRDALVADVGLGVGVALAAAATILFLMKSESPPPATGSGGDGVGFAWDF